MNNQYNKNYDNSQLNIAEIVRIKKAKHQRQLIKKYRLMQLRKQLILLMKRRKKKQRAAKLLIFQFEKNQNSINQNYNNYNNVASSRDRPSLLYKIY